MAKLGVPAGCPSVVNTEALVVGFTWQGLRGRTLWDQSWQTAQEAAGLCPLVSGWGGLVPPVLELDFQALAASPGLREGIQEWEGRAGSSVKC